MDTFIRTCIIAASFLCALSGPPANAADVCSLNFDGNSRIVFEEPTDAQAANPSFSVVASLYAANYGLTLNNEWPIKKLGTDTYAIRHVNWNDHYWVISKSSGRASLVERQPFASVKDGSALQGVSVWNRGGVLNIDFQSARLDINTVRSTASFLINGQTILGEGAWEVANPSYGVYRIRRSFWGRPGTNFFWEYDSHAGELYIVQGGQFNGPTDKNRLRMGIRNECK
jgi:hypothetical protein